MKKVFAAILAASMMLALVACGGGSDSSSAGTSSSGSGAASSSTTSSSAVSSSTVTLTGMQRVLFMNNAFAGLETSKQCYNAKEWHKSYMMGEIIDANFWFTPDEGTTVKTVAYTDFYEDECDLETFRGKYISFMQDNPEYDYDLFVGPNQKESSDVHYKGYCVVGNEVILMMQEEGWNVAELFDYVGMVDAEEYTFIACDGWQYTIAKEELTEEVNIIYNDNGGVDCYLPEYKTNMTAIRYIVPKGVTKETADQNAEGVQKITVALNAVGVYNTEAPYLQNRAGTYYDGCYSLNELFTKHSIVESNKVKIIASDGYSQREEYEDVISKYIVYQGPNEKGDHKEWFTLGQTQERDTGVWHIIYMVLDQDAFAFIPEAGITVADVFTQIEMADAANYLLTYADGTTETKAAADVKAMSLAADSNLLSITAVA